jgi:hypothetical protein
MGLRDRLKVLAGKTDSPTATRATDPAQQQFVHGTAPGQSSEERAGTRQRMEAELDGQRTARAAAAATLAAVPCPHITLVPHWEKATDMGHEDRASSYTCDTCHQVFTAEAGRSLRQTEADRVRQQLGS